MKHIVRLGLFAMIASIAWSCAERSICPAYQSAFIHDKETLRKHFSYFKEDSTPKILTASKNKFLVAEKQPYWKKRQSLNTVKMETIYPVLDDSTQLAGDVVLMAEMDVVDSVALDSAATSEIGWEEHFNVEQEFYFYYFNDILVYPEERALQEEADKQKDKIEKDQAERTEEKLNFFQKFLQLFKKKDDTVQEGDETLETSATDIEETDAPPKKKKRFGFGKKKDKSVKENEADTSEDSPPVQEEDDEDDDF